MKTCNKCQGTFSWKMPYDGTKLAVGDNPCSCGGHKENFAENFSKPKVTPSEILGEIAVFYELYKDVDAAKFESIAKIYISRSMSR